MKEVARSKKNFIKISSDSRILFLAGFGNLNGEIEIFNLVDYTLIGKTSFFCGVSLNWSFNSKYFIVSVLTPRVRVDNEYKVLIF
jgi:translation initiation factor 2A